MYVCLYINEYICTYAYIYIHIRISYSSSNSLSFIWNPDLISAIAGTLYCDCRKLPRTLTTCSGIHKSSERRWFIASHFASFYLDPATEYSLFCHLSVLVFAPWSNLTFRLGRLTLIPSSMIRYGFHRYFHFYSARKSFRSKNSDPWPRVHMR